MAPKKPTAAPAAPKAPKPPRVCTICGDKGLVNGEHCELCKGTGRYVTPPKPVSARVEEGDS